MLAWVLLCAQTAITFTGSLVRITGSGLGCDTWPNCHEGSLFPVAGAAPWIHQIIEFGNRLLALILAAIALAVFIAVVRAKRRKGILLLSFLQGIGIIVQAVIGGLTVRLDLAWWMVMAHFLPSMLLVFFAAKLVLAINEPDDGEPTELMPRAIAHLATGSAFALAAVLVTGTMTTAVGPHAGDEAILPEHRLQIPIVNIAHIHAGFMYLYLGLTIGLLAAVFALKLDSSIRKAAYWVIIGCLVQAGVGVVQWWLGVPRWTVPIHVIGSGIVTASTGWLWALRERRIGGSATTTGSLAADARREDHLNS